MTTNKIELEENLIEDKIRQKLQECSFVCITSRTQSLKINNTKSFRAQLKDNLNCHYLQLTNYVSELESRMKNNLKLVQQERLKQLSSNELEIRTLEMQLDDIELEFQLLEDDLKDWQERGGKNLNSLLDLGVTASRLSRERRERAKELASLRQLLEENGDFGLNFSSESVEGDQAARLHRNEKDTIIYNFEKVISGIDFINRFPVIDSDLKKLLKQVDERLAELIKLLEKDTESLSSVKTAVLRAVSSTHLPGPRTLEKKKKERKRAAKCAAPKLLQSPTSPSSSTGPASSPDPTASSTSTVSHSSLHIASLRNLPESS